MMNRSLHRAFCSLLALVGVLCFCGPAAADTASVHQNALFSHGLFAGKHWRLTSDTLDWQIPPSLTALTPRASRGAGLGDADLVTLSDGSALYAVAATLTDGYILTAADPLLLPGLDGSRPFDCLAIPASDTVIVASATGTASVQVLWLSPSGNILARDTAATIALIAALDLSVDGSGTVSLRVGGTSGRLRSLPLGPGVIGAAANLSIDPSQTITALSDSLAGTADGSIYRFVGSTGLLAGPGTQAIRAIAASHAVGDSGQVLLNDAGTWRTYTCGDRSWRASQLIGTANGQGVELLDSTMHYAVHTLPLDRPTVMHVVVGSGGTPLITDEYTRTQDADDTLFVSLDDPDGNALCPAIMIDGTIDLRTRLNDGSLLDPSLHPDASPSTGLRTLDPAAPGFRLILRADSVILLADTRVGIVDPFSFWQSWHYETWRSAALWSGSTCTVETPARTITLWAYTTTVLAASPVSVTVPGITVGPAEINLSFPVGSMASFDLVDMAGRTVLSAEDLRRLASCRLSTAHLASGIYCAQSRSVGGVVSSRRISIVR